MKLSTAESISLKSLLNAYFNEVQAVKFNTINDVTYATQSIQPFGFKLRVSLSYYSLTGRHQYRWPAILIANDKKETLHPWHLLSLLIQDLCTRYPGIDSSQREFMQRFFSSCDNLSKIYQHLDTDWIDSLFKEDVDFKHSENGLLSGHQAHPAPKSREGFSHKQLIAYSPEFQPSFQLYYFVADPSIIFTNSVINSDTNEIINNHFLKSPIKQKRHIIPLHPWQAEHIKQIPIIQEWLKNGLLTSLGPLGKAFTATTSVRTVYNENCDYMAKLSLSVAITNSVRTQLKKELVRATSAHQFWQSDIGSEIHLEFPQFTAITDPAYIALKHGDEVINETCCLFRHNPFTYTNNVTPLASLCQDHPFSKTNRFNCLISLVSQQLGLDHIGAASLWFDQFLHVAIKPLLALFIKYGVALEAHQQNLLIELKDGLPYKSYYRDSQGYYVVNEATSSLLNKIDISIFDAFCQGSKEFISHHFTYYLICNSVFGIINALGTSGLADEQRLMTQLALFLQNCDEQWSESNYLIPSLLNSPTLPFKGNLLTRFHELDELVASLEQQSVYIKIPNPIHHSLKSQLKG